MEVGSGGGAAPIPPSPTPAAPPPPPAPSSIVQHHSSSLKTGKRFRQSTLGPPSRETSQDPELSEDEELQRVVSLYKDLPCKVVIFPHHVSLDELLPLIPHPKDTVVALDFDQTLTQGHGVRGDVTTLKALSLLKERGATLVVITAQHPRVEVLKNMVQELRRLQLDSVFGVEDFSHAAILYDLLTSWGTNETLDTRRLSQKLLALLVLNTDRYPADLARLGASVVNFDSTKDPCVHAKYRLVHPERPSEDWSGEQTIEGPLEDSRLSLLVKTWQDYMARTAEYRAVTPRFLASSYVRPGETRLPPPRVADRTFLRATTCGSHFTEEPLQPQELRTLMEELLVEAGVPPNQRRLLMEDPNRMAKTAEGVAVARVGNVLASRYNKAEALNWFIAQEKLRPKRVVFVDDSTDNVMNMYFSLAQPHIAGLADPPEVYSCWYTPPPSGREERYDAGYRKLMFALAEIGK